MRVKLLRSWGQFPADRILTPPTGAAKMLIARGIAVRITDDNNHPVTTDVPETFAAPPKKRARKKTTRKA